jgi:photosystem II stability/assembly factor-like uncharacterized protein
MVRCCLLVILTACWSAAGSSNAPVHTWQVPAAWPVTPSLLGVHGTSMTNIYAVGDSGAVLHSPDRGTTWTRLRAPTSIRFRVACEPAIAGIVALSRDAALAMGNVTFTDDTGAQVKVDKTFGYRRDSSGALRIVLHHSSLPYMPPSVSATSAPTK